MDNKLITNKKTKPPRTDFIHPDKARLEISKQIKLARVANKFSLRYVEKETGYLVKRGALFNYEKGYQSPPADILPCLSHLYNMNIENFFPPLPKEMKILIDRYWSLLSNRSFWEILKTLEGMPRKRQKEVIDIILKLLKLEQK